LIPQLFCLPYAGASASVYGRWRRMLPGVDLHPVELPGRGRRFAEPLQDDMSSRARQLAEELSGGISGPYALFGHSLGALLAFEVAHALRERRRPAPEALFASGTAAPGRRDDREFAGEKSDAELVDHLRRLDGTAEAVFAEPDLMRLTLPVLRADFRMCGRYRYRRRPLLACPIHVLAGRDDTATIEQLLAWGDESGPGFTLSLFDGGHFFLFEHQAAVIGEIRSRLRYVQRPLRAVAG
jgi:surfactin synthase thioesterase subunit